MKRFILLLLLSLYFTLFYSQGSAQKESTHRIMTYNIRHGEGMDEKIDLERIGNLIIEYAPEVIGLQEVDSVVARSNNQDIMAKLAEQTGMYPSFSASIPLGSGKYGNGILTKEKPITTKRIALPDKKEPRSALIVELDEYVVISTHLALDEKDRLASVDLITQTADLYDKPVVLIGDLNDLPDSKLLKSFSKNWQVLSNTNLKTYPSSSPQKTLDYILGYMPKGETYAVFNYKNQVIPEKIISDHRPVFADIRFKSNAAQIMRTMPYLQNPSTTEMTIMWLTNVPCKSWIEYGTNPDSLQIVRNYVEGIMVANNKINQFTLTNLKPGKKYYYRVFSQEITRYASYSKTFGDTVKSELKSFKTLDDSNQDFRVILYNDIHSNVAMFEQLHDIVSKKPYDLVIFNGDCFDDAEKEEDIVDRLVAYTPKYRSDEIPAIFIRGNHETRGEYSLHLWDYLGRMNGRSYNAFSIGDTRFVLLDCGEDKPDEHKVYFDMNDFTQYRLDQTEFLKKEIASSEFKNANKRILIHHIPIFGENLDSYTPCSDLWKPVLKDVPFDIALNGHLHKHQIIEKEKMGNNFPVIIGGGNQDDTGTVMVLEKKGDQLTFELINTKGETITYMNL